MNLKLVVLSLSLMSVLSFAAVSGQYPTMPDDQLTPGALCEKADAYRYPEKIKYCNRGVTTNEKWQVIDTYDAEGFQIRKLDRKEFKIDHLIPLCAGGSNEPENLWPQHSSVYVVTDKIEATLCEVMAAGRISQVDAVELIINVKHHLETAPAVLDQLEKKKRRR